MRIRTRGVAAAIAVLLLSTLAVCQGVPIVVANLAPADRLEGWATIVVPNADLPAPPIRAQPHGWPAFYGERWGPHARLVHVRHGRLAPLEHVQTNLASVTSNEPLAASAVGVLNAASAAVHPLIPTIVVRVGSSESAWTPDQLRVVEGSAVGTQRVVLHGHERIAGTMLHAQAWFYVMPGHPVVQVEVMLTNSDPRSEEYVQQVSEVRLETGPGVWPVLDYHVRRGGSPTRAIAGGRLVTPLVGSTWLGHGQAFAWRGRLLLWRAVDNASAAMLNAEQHAPVVAQALPKAWEGHWGPWGALPALHPTEATDARGHGRVAWLGLYGRFAAQYRTPGDHPAGAIFTEPSWGMGWLPPMTGARQDFGATKLAPALSSALGAPAHVWELGQLCLYEALRPSFFYEANGEPLRYEDHPDCVFWGLENHYHTGVSSDRLGKKNGPGDDRNSVFPLDWAHYGSNNLAGFALLSGSHMARHLLQQQGTGWLLGSRVTGRRGSLGEARGWGRSMLGQAWGWLVTGDARILDRLRERFDVAFDDYLGREAHAVAPFGLYPPMGAKLNNQWPFWMPWQEALFGTGVDAGYQACYVLDKSNDMGKQDARRVLIQWAKTYVHKGWWLHQGRWTTGDAIRYDEGRDLAAGAYADETQVWPHWPGTAYDEWGSGAVAIARRWLSEAGDTAGVEKCDAIHKALDASYAGAGGDPRGFTEYSEWRATR